ncbi:MAG TPA: glycosyltransferase family 39 protein [Edaphobacter sp.]|nr:glycosyltransferase family 39 protein [Edaphobacter sp.]
MTRRQQGWLLVALPLLLGLGLRLWFIAHLARIDGDTLLYGDIAKNWLEHGVYGFTQASVTPRPTLIRLPGYPLFLAACFRVFGIEHYTAVMVVQTVVDLFTCVVVSALAGRLFGRRAAIAALWLAALCPFTANYVAAPLTETLSLMCIAVAFYGLERWRATALGVNRWLWVIALALAYAVLLRPEQGLLAAAVLAAMGWLGWSGGRAVRSVWPVALAAVCLVLPLAPWTVRNWRTFHVVQPLAPRSATDPGELKSLGFQRWFRSWSIDFASTEDVYWNYDGAEIDIGDVPSRAFDSEEQYERTNALLNDYNQTDNATAAIDARFGKIAAERIENDPVRYYLALPVARLLDMTLRPRTEMMPVPLDWWHWEHRAKSFFAAGYAGLNLAYLVLGGVGFWFWRRRRWDRKPALAWAMVGFVILRCAVLLTLDNSEPRYTLEFFPVIFVCSAVVFSRSSDGRWSSSCRS